MLYQSPSQIGTWNGWTEPVLPPPSVSEIRHGLAVEIDRELAKLPIRQQTVIVAVCHVGEGAWTVDILDTPPPRGKYDGWAECLVDFDQYHGTPDEMRRFAAEDLAYDLMTQAIPDWRTIQEFGPAWDADPPDWN